MKTRLMIIGSALMASLFCMPALAQTGPGTGPCGAAPCPGGMGPGMGQGMGPGMGMGPGAGQGMGRGMGPRGPRDCTQAPNPEACKAHQQARDQARAACGDKFGQERKACMGEQMQNFDCAKSGNPPQCEARKKVYQECKGQAGPAFRQCVQQKMPPVECSTATDPKRCEQVQKARAACKDKPGSEYMACLSAQINGK